MNDFMMRNQDRDNAGAVYNSRPLQLAGPSIGVYHPIFASFREQLAKLPPLKDIPADDRRHAHSFIEKSLEYYADKQDRQYAIRCDVEHFLEFPACTTATVSSDVGTFWPSGRKMALVECYSCDVPVLIVEVKNGLGLGHCDAMDQAEKDYLLECIDKEVRVYASLCFG